MLLMDIFVACSLTTVWIICLINLSSSSARLLLDGLYCKYSSILTMA